MRRLLYIAAASALGLSCGGSEADGGDSCSLSFNVFGGEPVVVPDTVVLDAVVTTGLIGFRELEWRVSYGGDDVAIVVRDEDNTSIEFSADQPGPYDVYLSGSVGTVACSPGNRTLNLQPPDALDDSYLLQVVTDEGAAYSRLVTIYGGADHGLGTIEIDSATPSITVRDSSGLPMESFVRLEADGFEAAAAELATSSGQLDLALAAGTYRLEVTPYDALLAPFAVSDLTAPDLPASVQAPTPTNVAATVSSGGALAGARVRIAVDDGPGSVATTIGSGLANVPTSPGATATIDVYPPDGAVLPRLSFSTSGVPSSVAIAYSAPTTRAWSFTVLDAGGSPAPGAIVHLDASYPDAGTHNAGVGAQPATGRFVRTFVADGSGDIGPVTVINAEYAAIVSTGPGLPTLLSVDLRTGQTAPGTLSAADPVAVTGTVTGPEGALAGARVSAMALGQLAGHGADTPATETSGDGSYSLSLAEGESYDVVVSAAQDGSYARMRSTVVAQLGAVLDLEVPAAVAVTGRLQQGGAAVARTMVVILDPITGSVVASTLTGEDGSFALPVRDPGTL